MHLRSKITLLLVVLTLTAPQLVHADTMGWDFTLFKYILGDPTSPPGTPILTDTDNFFLSVWDPHTAPTDYTILGDHVVLNYPTVSFYPEGVTILDSFGGEFFDISSEMPGLLWTGDPQFPTFKTGTYYGERDTTSRITIVAVEAPEPSTIGLLGTGALGLLGAFRRRMLKN